MAGHEYRAVIVGRFADRWDIFDSGTQDVIQFTTHETMSNEGNRKQFYEFNRRLMGHINSLAKEGWQIMPNFPERAEAEYWPDGVYMFVRTKE